MNKTKRNLIILGSSLLLILIIYINIGTDNSIDKSDKNSGITVVESFIETYNLKKYKELNKYMTAKWKNKDIQSCFIGSDVDTIEIEHFDLNHSSKYLDSYLVNHPELKKTSDKFITITTTLNYKYNKNVSKNNQTIKTVFLLCKMDDNWLIDTFGTESMFAFIN